MLSVFPYFLNFWMYAPLILRIVVGVYFISFGYSGLKKDRWEKEKIFETVGLRPAKYYAFAVSVVEIAGGVLLILGLFVQVVAIIFAVISATAIAIKIHGGNELRRDINIYILLLVILVSIFILGPGRLAFDLPL